MKKLKLELELTEYTDQEELDAADRELLETAWKASQNAYAPYSKFYVGAAVKLSNGRVVTGNNQENAAFPSGLCAERVAVFSASSLYPGIPVETIAIVAQTDVFEIESPVTPCGACRQVISEYEHLSENPIRIIMQSGGKTYIANGIRNLLPLMFIAPGLRI